MTGWLLRLSGALGLATLVLGLSGLVFAAERRAVEIWSEGRRLAGDLWLPTSSKDGTRHPAIVMAHGWGGVRAHLNSAYARQFAAAGFVVLTFDYRGWGGSDSRLVLVDKEPELGADGLISVRAKPVRRVVDPIVQTRDIVSAIDFVSGEPAVDGARIALWGTSYAGGHVVYVAARDKRVRTIVAQVGYMGVPRQSFADQARLPAVQKARGEIAPLPDDLDCIPRLRGCPDLAKTINFRPIELADRITVPTLIIDAEDEELFDRIANGPAVYDIVKARAAADYVLFEGSHYDIYNRHRVAAIERAIAWFETNLGNAGN